MFQMGERVQLRPGHALVESVPRMLDFMGVLSQQDANPQRRGGYGVGLARGPQRGEASSSTPVSLRLRNSIAAKVLCSVGR